MLKLAGEQDKDIILDICNDDLLGTRIACYALAYGFERDFLNIWFDTDSSTVIAKFYDSMTVAGDCNNPDEIRDFISMSGFCSLELSLENCKKLGFEADDIKKSHVFAGDTQDFEVDNINEEYYKALYSLVSENIPGSFDNSKEAYLSFISDLTFRRIRGLARCKGVISEGKLLSSVITSAETKTCALISAVASDKNSRGKGLGKITVMSIVDELINENKKVYVIALNESAQGFYEHLGFIFYCDIATVKM